MKKTFEIVTLKQNGSIYGICPQLGLVIDDEDHEIVVYRLLYEIKSYANDKNRDKLHIPNLPEEMQESFDKVKNENSKQHEYWEIKKTLCCANNG
ncbi:MAG: hypothetical protein US89_C0004G0101 [Candidatus Peregrinibacteria bacterium GW2011_GWF2_38_29]|nr:MAG: hypothetical protein US89_C0004G0101 [Candidatus Peregrinibacteria bacterium GW2011_GWF2_38_29]HBB03035.1 hypothetical protein [Candidatus Peregrinibacteria bacterium]